MTSIACFGSAAWSSSPIDAGADQQGYRDELVSLASPTGLELIDVHQDVSQVLAQASLLPVDTVSFRHTARLTSMLMGQDRICRRPSASPDRLSLLDKFTDRARKIIALAQKEAERFKHDYIGTEHILLGLVKEGSGVAVTALNNLSVDVDKVRAEVEKLVVSHEKDGPSTPLLFTPRPVPSLARGGARSSVTCTSVLSTSSSASCVRTSRRRPGAGEHWPELEDVRAEILDLLGATDLLVSVVLSARRVKIEREQRTTRAQSEDSTTLPSMHSDAISRRQPKASSTQSSAAARKSNASGRSCAAAPRTTRSYWVSLVLVRPPSLKAWLSQLSRKRFLTYWQTNGSSASTSLAWLPAPSTAVSSKSASRR